MYRSFAVALVLAASPAVLAATVAGRVVAPANALSETVVYLKDVPGTHAPSTRVVDQRRMAFVPHVLAITAGDTVDFLNSDTVPHNVFSREGGYDLGTFLRGQKASHTFAKPGAYAQRCNIHADMLAWVFVGQNPYSAVVDSSGAFRIDGAPAGTFRIAIWNPGLKAPDQAVTLVEGTPAHANFALKR